MDGPKFVRVRLEVPEVKKAFELRKAIEAEFGPHPYLYPPAVKAQWIRLTELVMA